MIIPTTRALCWLAVTLAALPVMAADNELTEAERKAGWILLFDGQSLKDWMTSDWEASKRPVEDGAINPHKAGGYMMVYEQQWENFMLDLDFRISPGCNSGVFLRTSPLKSFPTRDVGYNGIEIQIIDTPGDGYTDTGAIYDLARPTTKAMRAIGEWNHLHILCDRNIIDVILNDKHVNRLDLDQWTQPYLRPDGSKHKFEIAYKYHPRVGYIGLQDHGSDAWFKNIKLKPL